MIQDSQQDVGRQFNELAAGITVGPSRLERVGSNARARRRRTRAITGATAVSLTLLASGLVALRLPNQDDRGAAPATPAPAPSAAPKPLDWPATYRPTYLPAGFGQWIPMKGPFLDAPLRLGATWTDDQGRSVDLTAETDINKGLVVTLDQVPNVTEEPLGHKQVTEYNVGRAATAFWDISPGVTAEMNSSQLDRAELLDLAPTWRCNRTPHRRNSV
jgi:hypothetical protein